MKFRQTSRPVLFSSVLIAALLLAGCAGESETPVPTGPTETPTATTQPTEQPDPTEEPDDGWTSLSVDKRCEIIASQVQGVDWANRIPLDQFLLSATLTGDLVPDCVVNMNVGGSLPTQFSIYVDGYVGLKDEIVTALEKIAFYPFTDSATLASLQSQEAPGNMVVEHWEAEALLEYSDEVRNFDLSEVVIVLLTANYDPDFDADMDTL